MASPGLYIHVPFCLTKCHYCGFYSDTDCSLMEGYEAALRREMAFYKDWTEPFDTLYLGGGTPSVLAPRQLATLIADAQSAFPFSANTEITIEMNPADMTAGLMQAVSQAGGNRISIGVQSFDDDILIFLGRRHRAEQAESAVKVAKKAGFENISIDLIYGIPGQEMKVWEETLQRAVALQPQHLSCYQLTVERGTPFANSIANGTNILPDENMQAEFFFRTSELLEKYGYLQYEVSNFAIPGKESRHNRKYWDHTPCLGLGPSAHTFRGRKRHWNRADIITYINDLQADRLPVEQEETLDPEKLRMETLFLGFRTSRGISLDEYRLSFGKELLEEKQVEISHFLAGGFVEISGGFLKPTRRGMAVADSLALL